MIALDMEMAGVGAVPSGASPVDAAAGAADSSFATAMTEADVKRMFAPGTRGAGVVPPHESVRDALARRLDEIGRQRVEAQTLSAGLAGAWASGADISTLALAMHHQARATAGYNLSVMWAAKMVGVTTGALRQLVTAT